VQVRGDVQGEREPQPALKHALWKGDLWLADDLINDNYFSALSARADLEAERYAMYTKCTAYKDKRQNASSNGSSVIADLTFSAAKQEKTRSDFYSRAGASASNTTSSVVATGEGGGVGQPYQTSTRAGKRHKKFMVAEGSTPQVITLPTTNSQDTTATLQTGGRGRGNGYRGKHPFPRGGRGFGRGSGTTLGPTIPTTPSTEV
jgi:hypothetical protein